MASDDEPSPASDPPLAWDDARLEFDPSTDDEPSPTAAASHRAGQAARASSRFYARLEGTSVAGDAVVVGSDVDLVFEYSVPRADALTVVDGWKLREAASRDLDLGVTILPRGFTWREEVWTALASFRGGQLLAPVRFALRAGARRIEDAGFHVSLDVDGCPLYQFFIRVRLVPALEPDDALYTPVAFDLDIDEAVSERARVLAAQAGTS
jgi:hypothetical protein